MKKLIFIFLILFGLLFGTEWIETNGIWNGDYDVGKTLASTDSITYSSTTQLITLKGTDALNLFIPIRDSEGAIKVWGIATNTTGSGADNLYFSWGNHSGDGETTKSGFTVSYTALDTAAMSALGSAQFEVYPMSNSTIRQQFSTYYDLKIWGDNNHTRTLYIKIEWLEK